MKKYIKQRKTLYGIFCFLKTLYACLMRNHYILYHTSRRTKKHRINLHYYSEGEAENLGDYLSVIVYNYMLSDRNIDFDYLSSQTKHIYCIGSIIAAGWQNATIWGSGLMNENFHGLRKLRLCKIIRNLDIRAVRGPITREILINKGFACPEIYGDPAVLMPLIYTPKQNDSKKEDFTVILHHSSFLNYENNLSIKTTDYEHFIDTIANSNKVISSSLHGVILAETYGVSAILLDDVATQKSLVKFNDWYYSTNRRQYPIAKSIEEAITMKPVALPDNLDELRKGLLEAFPYDIYE